MTQAERDRLDALLAELGRREDGEGYERAWTSLEAFVRQAWPILEPTRPIVWNWHLSYLCEWLECITFEEAPLPEAVAALAGMVPDGKPAEPVERITRLMVNEPPRHMKSLIISVLWPCWEWTVRPSLRYLCVSYAAGLSTSLSLKRRRVLESDWYRMGCESHWREEGAPVLELTSDQNVKTLFENNARGQMIASSIGGIATGEGGERVIIDDPLNPREALSVPKRQNANMEWDETLSSRLNDAARDVFVVVMQRLHEDDFTGHLVEEGGWLHVIIQSVAEVEHDVVFPRSGRVIHRAEGDLLWPERFGPAVIEKARKYAHSFAGQHQQLPRPKEGAVFDRGWFEIVDDYPHEARKVRRWDLAATAAEQGKDPDWTAGGLVGLHDGIWYVIDMVRFRGTPKTVQERIAQTAALDGKTIPIRMEEEGGSSGKGQTDHYARRVLVGYSFEGKRSTGSKLVRADPVAAAAEAGNVKLVRGDWNVAFLDEAERFTGDDRTHDDQIDVVSGAFEDLAGNWLADFYRGA